MSYPAHSFRSALKCAGGRIVRRTASQRHTTKHVSDQLTRRANSYFPSKNIRRKGTHPRYPFANNVNFTSLVSSRILSCSMNAGCANHRVICHDTANFSTKWWHGHRQSFSMPLSFRDEMVLIGKTLETLRYPVCRAFGPWHCDTCKRVLCSTCTQCTFRPPHGLEREGAEIMQSCLTRLVHVPGLRYMTRWGRRLRRIRLNHIQQYRWDVQTIKHCMVSCSFASPPGFNKQMDNTDCRTPAEGRHGKG